jgi:diguanylate cyclase
MRYQQSREESAAILRRALQLMSPHRAGYHPLSYAVWYEHVAELNPALTQELKKLLASEGLLSDAEICRLHALHIAARDVETFELAGKELRELLGKAGQDTLEAETTVQRFTVCLEEAKQQLSGPEGAQAARRVISEVLQRAWQARTTLKSLHEQLIGQREQFAVVMERLERAQAEPLRDPLTGLNNLYGFKRAVEMRAQSADLSAAAFLAVDVDNFKRVNDTHGHVIGDKVLQKIAEILSGQLAVEDVAARVGGDEFVVFLPARTLAAAASLAEKIRASAERTLIVRADGGRFAGEVTLSIGAAAGCPGDTLESLRHNADVALYSAKAAGRNRVVLAADRLTS